MGLSWLSVTLVAVLLASVYFKNRMRVNTSSVARDEQLERSHNLIIGDGLSKQARQLKTKLIAALPHIVISPDNTTTFDQAARAYWDQKACEATPAAIVRPRNVWELASAVKILKREFDQRSQNKDEKLVGTFAIRSGGHSPVAGASSIKGGALIDLSLFNTVTLSADGTSVAIGAGCKWVDVYKTLEAKGYTVAGGRNSAVGVGGLTLGGGLSFFSPCYGFVCSNIIDYQVVLADGSVTRASESENPDLWRALKGGSNNFGIVTRFTARSFPSADIWSGFLYLPSFEAPRVLTAFHEFVNRVNKHDSGTTYDEHAAGPLTCFTYLQQLGIQAIAVNLVHTKHLANNEQWPDCWRNSSFVKLWRFWSTCTVRSLTSATDELSVLNPPGRRQEFATTTVRNDMATLVAVHKVYAGAITTIRKHNVKKMSWTLVLQPLLPEWAQKGDTNVLGLTSDNKQPLVIVSFTVNWALSKHDEIVQQITRDAITQIDAFATQHHTSHPYRYLNYCGSWQKPFEGCGAENLDLLKDVSRRIDPDGFFQHACAGGFKLGL